MCSAPNCPQTSAIIDVCVTGLACWALCATPSLKCRRSSIVSGLNGSSNKLLNTNAVKSNCRHKFKTHRCMVISDTSAPTHETNEQTGIPDRLRDCQHVAPVQQLRAEIAVYRPQRLVEPWNRGSLASTSHASMLANRCSRPATRCDKSSRASRKLSVVSSA